MKEQLIERVYEILRKNPHYFDCEIETLCCLNHNCYEIYDLITTGETMKVAKWLVEEEIITESHFN